MIIIGISAFYHDSAAAIIKNGEIIAAAQEERFTRIKHDASFPYNALQYCLKEAKLNSLSEVDYITFYEKPFLKFERLIETYVAYAPLGFKSFSTAMPIWLKDKLFQKKKIFNSLKKISDQIIEDKILFVEHHESHAASAFYPSPFHKSAVLTLDGVGEWCTSSVSIGNKNSLEILKEQFFPHSIGLLYSAFTYYAGFKVNSGEYKLMGLAPYGKPVFKEKILDNLIDLKDDGSFKMDLSYFDYCVGLKMINRKFENLFGRKTRKPESKITQHEMDIASSIQEVTEEIVLRICNFIAKETKEENLCLAGGVALNCVANGKIARKKIFKNIWIQPAAGDAGGALGAALLTYYNFLKRKRKVDKNDSMYGSYLGPRFEIKNIKEILKKCNAKFSQLSKRDVIKKTAKDLADGKTIGWFNGRMEFGPRALGGRSIIADPRSKKMQKNLNLKIKFRESFRPFAPSILEDQLSKWFELDMKSPYMLLVDKIKDNRKLKIKKDENKLFGIEKLNTIRSIIPAVTHVDFSARIQTVSKNTNPPYYELIRQFHKLTGCPILVNTSFNVRGEPLVCDPKDAYECFMATNLDILVIENFYLEKENQKSLGNRKDYLDRFTLD